MKRILLSLMAILAVNIAYGQVKATSAELNAGVDDAKFATALALQGSKYLDQSGAKLYAVTAAGANAYTAAIAPAITAYSAGQVFFIKITTANTGASTLNLNGLGIKSLVKDAATALVGGDLLANRIYAVAYDGTNFQVVNVADALKANLVSPVFTGIPTAPTAAAGTNTTQLATTAFVNSAMGAPGALTITSATVPQLLLRSSATDVTNKSASIGISHYTNIEEPLAGILMVSGATTNTINIGGGTGTLNAATQIDLYTAANNTTTLGTSRLSINSAGLVNATTWFQTPKIGLGIAPTTATANFFNTSNITGGLTSIANFTLANVLSDVTSAAYGTRSDIGTQDASFTVPNLYHNAVRQGIFGAGSTVTNQFGYYADASLIGATGNNYGFYGNIAAAAGTWNFVANGTALNAFRGSTLFGSNAITGGALGQLTITPNADATKGIVVRANSATQSANLQEWQTSAGTAQTVVDNTGNLGINAGANLYHVIGTDQQTVYNPAYYYSNATTTGAIVFKHATASAATMFDIKLKFYRYNTNTSLGELRISFYKPDAILINSTTGKYAYTIGNPPIELDQVRVGFDASGNLSIILSDVGTAWNTHNRVIITEVTTSYTGGTNSAWRNGWTSAVETDLSAYTSLTALPITNMSLNGFIQNSALGQTADLRITGVGLFGGRVTAGTISNLGQFTVVPAADATKGQVIRAFSPTQSGNLYEAQTSTGAINFSVSPTGSVATVANMIAGVSFIGNDFRNTAASNNSNLQLTNNGTTISRNIADANDVLAINNINTSSTGLILDAQAAGSTVASISKTGLGTFSGLNIAIAPTTSAGTYDVLTRNTATGAIEKTSSSVFTTAAANVVYAGPLTGTAIPTFRKLGRSDIEEAFGAATTSGVLDWNDITNTQPGFSPTLITGASANGPGGSAYYHPFTMEHSSKTGSGNMTQIGYPYNPGVTDGITWRWRYSNTWSAWRKVWDSSNFTNLNQLTTRNYSDLQNKPTTLAGFGVTDKVLKYVAETSGGNASDYGYWTKIASINLGASDYVDYNVQLGFAGNSGTWGSAIVDVGVRQNTSSVPPELSVSIMSAGPGVNWLGDDSFKLVSNGYGTKVDLYMKKYIIWGHIKIYEMASNSNFGSISYLSSQGWSATAPTGTYTANSSGIKYKTNNIYHAGNDNVLNHPINGFSVGTNTSVTAADHIKSAIEKLQGQVNAKESAISAGTTTQYRRGDKTWQTLNTSAVPEGTNLYHTSSRVLSTPLTGYAVGANTALAAGDTELIAFGKLQGQLNNALHKAGNELVTGTLGIGITSGVMPAGYKFAVGGGIIAESVKVKPHGEWPDYVFEKGYPMLSLGDLEKFILKNKHLPDVPAAAEVKKEGLDLGEMDSKLLKKIEELTLYLIDLKKENETLKERLDKLEKK